MNEDIKLIDIFFSELSYQYKKEKVGKLDLKINYKVDFLNNSQDPTISKTCLQVFISDTFEQFNIHVTCNGIFKLDSSLTQETKSDFLKNQSINILFPYVRSEVILLTSQPGIMPIQLPLIDASKLTKPNHTIN